MSAVRQYDGTNDETRITTTLALTAAYTIAFVMKATGGDGAWMAPMVTYASGDTAFRTYIERDNNNKLRLGNSSAFTITTPTFTVADGWFFFCASKASGTVNPVFYWRKAADGSLSNETSASTLPNDLTISGGHVRIGDFDGGDWLNARMARLAFWDGTALNSTQVTALLGGTLNDWKIGSPAPSRLYEFDQASTSTAITDQMASGDNQGSQVETTVITNDVPPTSLISMSSANTYTKTGLGVVGP